MPRLRSAARGAIEAGVRAFNRNPWMSQDLQFIARDHASPLYSHDCLTTRHIHSFMDEPDFQRAYRRAVKASGWDYKIYWRVHVMLWAASVAQAAEGAFVECGTGRGFMASAICEHLAWDDRDFFLLDTFDARAVSPDREHPDDDTPVSRFYATSLEAVRANFSEWRGVQLVVGRVPATLGDVSADSVAFLHIDLNHPGPEEAALRHFWPLLAPGGIVVFDDYAVVGCQTQHASTDRVASELGVPIVSLPTGQGLAIKTV